MAVPRVFVSSTYYDLKHMRASLQKFIESVGFEAILFERGDIAYQSFQPLDQSCYRDAATADIFVLIVGGRYGSAASGETVNHTEEFYAKYNSVTREEYESAIREKVPVYTAVQRDVYAEYQTFKKNRDSTNVRYAHVDNVSVFNFLDAISGLPNNNPIFTFDKPADLESWLLLQWAGLFGDMLREKSQRVRADMLSQQISSLATHNETLKNYLEALIKRVDSKGADAVIEREEKRLIVEGARTGFRQNQFVKWAQERAKLSTDQIEAAIRESETVDALLRRMHAALVERGFMFHADMVERWMTQPHPGLVEDMNAARATLTLAPFPPFQPSSKT